MAPRNGVRAAHRGDGGDPRKAVQLGGEAVARALLAEPIRTDTAIGAALLRALEAKRGRP